MVSVRPSQWSGASATGERLVHRSEERTNDGAVESAAVCVCEHEPSAVRDRANEASVGRAVDDS